MQRSSCRPASPALTGWVWLPNGNCCGRPAPTACAWSVPTRRGCCRRGRRCASTPPSRGPCQVRAGWRSPRSRAGSGSPCSTWPATWASGVHSFVSLGAKLDVSSNDLLAAWMDDDQVAAAALHLESFGNALKFARTARRFAERKPLLGVLGGRSTGSAIGVDALFAQAGVIPCRSATEVAETAALLLGQPMPAGYRVGVVTNAGGMGTLVADLADAEGLSVPKLSGEGRAAVQRAVPGAVRTDNPVDLGADLSPAALEAGVRALLSAARARCARGRPGPHQPGRPQRALRRAVPGPGAVRPAGPARGLQRGRARAPRRRDRLPDRGGSGRGAGAHDEVRRMAAGPGRGSACGRWAYGPPSPARGPTERLAARGGTAEWLPASASAELLGPYGIDHVGVEARDADEACRAAAAIGFPVVVKVADPTSRAQDRPRAGAGRTADTGGRGCRRRRLPRRAGQRLGRRPRAAGARRRRGGLRRGPRPGVRAPGPDRRGWRRDRGLEGRGLPGAAGDQRRRGQGPCVGCVCGPCSKATGAARGSTWRRCSRSWLAWASSWSTYPRCRTSTSTRCSSPPTACIAST